MLKTSRQNRLVWGKIPLVRVLTLVQSGGDDVDHSSRPFAANVRFVADDRRVLPRQKNIIPAIVIYSVVSGFASLTIGAVASFAASSGAGKLALWWIVTGTTASAAGIAYESRLLRGFRLSICRWLQLFDRL